MRDKLRYKEFIGSVHFSSEDEVFYGRIEGINDLVTFEDSTVNKLKKAFREAVKDSLSFIRKLAKKYSSHLKEPSMCH